MPASVDSTAIISSESVLADDVVVGPYSVIGPNVTIGAGTIVGPHTRIEGWTRIGERNSFTAALHRNSPQTSSTKASVRSLYRQRQHLPRVRHTTAGRKAGGGITTIGSGNSSWRTRTSRTTAQSARIRSSPITLPWLDMFESGRLRTPSAHYQRFTSSAAWANTLSRRGAHDRHAGVLPFVRPSAAARRRIRHQHTIGWSGKRFTKETIEALQRAYRI